MLRQIQWELQLQAAIWNKIPLWRLQTMQTRFSYSSTASPRRLTTRADAGLQLRILSSDETKSIYSRGNLCRSKCLRVLLKV